MAPLYVSWEALVVESHGPLGVAHGRDLGQAPRHPGLAVLREDPPRSPGHGDHFTGCCLPFVSACMDLCGVTWEPFMNLFMNGCLLMSSIFIGMTRHSWLTLG